MLSIVMSQIYESNIWYSKNKIISDIEDVSEKLSAHAI